MKPKNRFRFLTAMLLAAPLTFGAPARAFAQDNQQLLAQFQVAFQNAKTPQERPATAREVLAGLYAS